MSERVAVALFALVLVVTLCLVEILFTAGSAAQDDDVVAGPSRSNFDEVVSATERWPDRTTTTAAPTTTTTATTTTVPPIVEPPPNKRATTPPPTEAPPPPSPPRATGACAGWESLIAAHFPAEQVAKACAVMMCETGGTGSPTIHNASSSASGLFQFLDSTWRSTTGLAPPAANYPPEQQIAAAATLWRSSGWSPWVCA